MPHDTWWVNEEQLDDDQTNIVALPPTGSYLVVGPPGSGKTNLLLLRASYLVDAGKPNLVVLMFTRMLREFVVDGTSEYGVAAEKIRTITSWERNILAEHGIGVKDQPFQELRLELARRLADLLDKKPALEGHLDCILVDEVQDCIPEEIDLFLRSAQNVFFTGDNRQQIYEDHGIFGTLQSRVSTKVLSRHYRNGEAICRVADTIGRTFGEQPLFPYCNYSEVHAKSSVNFEQCSSDKELIEKLGARLGSQLIAYPGELLGVACATNNDAEAIRNGLSGYPAVGKCLLPDGRLSDPSDPQRRIAVCTLADAKGLEFRAFHMPFGEHITKGRERQKRWAFTGVTRAKTSLSVYYVRNLPAYFEQANVRISAQKGLPKVADLFRRARGKGPA